MSGPDGADLWGAPPAAGPSEGPAPMGVAELTRRIAGRLDDLGPLVVEGEVSAPKRATSGHVYFDLKDEGAVLSCVIWRSAVARAVPRGLEAGARARAHGRLDVYAPRGSYSLVVTRLEPVGEGELLARLERLKRELAARGWFDRRRPLPAVPRLVGVVTSRDGAALRDLLRTRSLRWPGFPVRLRHAPVQGPGAAQEVARAIADLAASGVDLVVVTRGGGSLEDLWTFNEEPVARAIWECPVPVVSAVGHETDTTLSDLVADHRAHTPTDAGRLVFPDRRALAERLERAGGHLMRALEDALEGRAQRLARAARSAELHRPERLIAARRERLAHLAGALERRVAGRLVAGERALVRWRERLGARSPAAELGRRAERAVSAAERLRRASAARIAAAEKRLAVGAATLEAISPLRVLARGYSVTLAAGRAVRRAEEVAVGDLVETRVEDGAIESRVTAVRASASEPGPGRG